MSSRRRPGPTVVAERYALLLEAGLPERQASLWSQTRAIGGRPREVAEVASEWWATGFTYAQAIGWIRVVGKWGCWVARRHRDDGFCPSQVRAARIRSSDVDANAGSSDLFGGSSLRPLGEIEPGKVERDAPEPASGELRDQVAVQERRGKDAAHAEDGLTGVGGKGEVADPPAVKWVPDSTCQARTPRCPCWHLTGTGLLP